MQKIIEFIYNKPLVSLILLLSIFLLPVFISWIITYGKTPVEIVIAPSDADVQINGEVRRSRATHLTPGEYTINASRDGFEDYVSTIVVDKEPLQIPILLLPINDEGWRVMDEQSDIFLIVEGLVGDQAAMEGEMVRQSLPIIRNLPHRSLLFSIDYRMAEGSDTEIILQITADNDVDRGYALDQIRNWGFDPEDFEIEYL